MKIKHYIHEDRFVIEVTPKDREEEEKVRKFIEWAELNAEMSVNNEKCRSKGEGKMNGTTTRENKNYTIGSYTNFVQQGWQCPLCKRILAPFIIQCPYNHDSIAKVEEKE